MRCSHAWWLHARWLRARWLRAEETAAVTCGQANLGPLDGRTALPPEAQPVDRGYGRVQIDRKDLGEHVDVAQPADLTLTLGDELHRTQHLLGTLLPN